MKKRQTLLHTARTLSVSLPATLFLWILLIVVNPDRFEPVYVMLILQPIVFMVVKLVLYLHRLWSQRIEKQRNEMPPAPAPNETKKKEEHKPPLVAQTYKERERTPEEEWDYLGLMYY